MSFRKFLRIHKVFSKFLCCQAETHMLQYVPY